MYTSGEKSTPSVTVLLYDYSFQQGPGRRDVREKIPFLPGSLIYSGRGDFDRALVDYSRTVELDREYVEAYNKR